MIDAAEQFIVIVLLILLVAVLLYATMKLVFVVGIEVIHSGMGTDSLDQQPALRDLFSGFLLVLIGIELMRTISMYVSHQAVHTEVVFAVAVIAVARHAINVDYDHASAPQLLGLAALILALSAGYYLVHRAGPMRTGDPEP